MLVNIPKKKTKNWNFALKETNFNFQKVDLNIIYHFFQDSILKFISLTSVLMKFFNFILKLNTD